MTSLPLFLLESRVPIGLSVLLGLIGGAGSAGIIAMIHAVVTAQDRPSYWSWLFAGAVLAVILARMGAALLVTRLAQRLICDLRIDLSH